MKNKKTVRAIIIGRLGNQMFQYANAKEFARKYNAKLKLIFCGIDNQLGNFDIENAEFMDYDGKKIPFYQKLVLKIYNKIRLMYAKNDRRLQQKFDDKWKKLLGLFGIVYNTVGYLKYPKIRRKNILLVGYFESPEYFKNIDSDIRQLFYNVKTNNNKIQQICKEAEGCNSVAVSIRRGDFVELNTVVCNKKYYIDAIKKIEENVENPKYFIFSDDVEWVKNNMDFPKDSFYESSDLTIYDIMKIRSHCKNFILTNSTFSWWGAYLSKEKDKIIVAPKYWRHSGAKIDLVDKNWILIDNKPGDIDGK